MKADVSYNDFIGTVAADISDHICPPGQENLISIGKYFKIDESKFEVVGLSIYGPEGFSISLICIDKERSTAEKDYLVSISVEVKNEKVILDKIFKRLHFVLYDKYDKKYINRGIDEELRLAEIQKTKD